MAEEFSQSIRGRAGDEIRSTPTGAVRTNDYDGMQIEDTTIASGDGWVSLVEGDVDIPAFQLLNASQNLELRFTLPDGSQVEPIRTKGTAFVFDSLILDDLEAQSGDASEVSLSMIIYTE